MSTPESQITELIKERRFELLKDARINEDILFAEIPAYLTEKEQTPGEIVKKFNEDYGTSLSENRARLVLNALASGNNMVHKEIKDGEDYFSIINPQ